MPYYHQICRKPIPQVDAQIGLHFRLAKDDIVYNGRMFPIGLNELMLITGLCCVLIILPLAIALTYSWREKRK